MKYRNWQIPYTAPQPPEALLRAGYSPLLAVLLALRGYADPVQARAFLSGGDQSAFDPMLLQDMDKAVARIRTAIERRENVAVFGDYDVDGITSTCVLTDYLRRQGVPVHPYIPDRIEEGYGLNMDAITNLQRTSDITLIITVDCGITAIDETNYALQRGIDMVITDHHECSGQAIPNAVAVVDPKRPGSQYPNSGLAGVGVAYKLLCALEDGSDRVLREYGDLVAIGTVADVMQLTGENRFIVTLGLNLIPTTRRVGLTMLLKESRVNEKPITASFISFSLAPRINAAGRMGCPFLAVDLLLTDDPLLAAELAQEHISTIEEAEAVFQRSEATMKGARRVLSRLGMRRSPSMDEVDLYLKWTEQWGFEPRAVEAACRETTKGSPTFGYLDKVLEGIRSRSGGQAVTGKAVERTLEAEQEETAHIRELLQALGISRAVVDEGMRRLYRSLTAMGGHEAALLAAREVAASGRAHSLDNVAALLEAWNAKGLTTAEAIEAHLTQVRALNRRIRGLMDLCGHRGGCTQANRELLTTWETQWNMPAALVDLAAEFARGVDKPMPYMNRLLEGWRKSGALTVEAARAEHERFQSSQKGTDRPAAPAKRVIEQQYEQRTYDPDEFGDLSEEQLEELNRK